MTTPTLGSDSAGLLASNALPVGMRVGEFEITRVVGEGGFSVVYLAFDHTLHRSIALKEYIPSALASRRGDKSVAVRSAQHQPTFEAGLRSFINEARLLAQFDHPALVKVYRFWEANGTAYMAMPYYDGRTLKQILRDDPGQASEAWLKELLTPLLDALELLHAHRCYHRDIAPDNIQILASGAPVLLDFGAARRTIGDMTQAFTVILKPGYAPIEQYADEMDLKQGPWTDVYALSAVLYGGIVGKPPPTAVARMIKDPLVPLSKRGLSGYSESFLAAIDSGLGVRPEARPQSIGQWRDLLGVGAVQHRAAGTPRRVPLPPIETPPVDTLPSEPTVLATGMPSAAPGTSAPISPPLDGSAAGTRGRDDGNKSSPFSPEIARGLDHSSDQTVLVSGLRKAREPERRNADSTGTVATPAALQRNASRLPLRQKRIAVLAGIVVAGLAFIAYWLLQDRDGKTVVATTVPAAPSVTGATSVESRPTTPTPNEAVKSPAALEIPAPPPAATTSPGATNSSAAADMAGSAPVGKARPQDTKPSTPSETSVTPSVAQGKSPEPSSTTKTMTLPESPATATNATAKSQETAPATAGKSSAQSTPTVSKAVPAAIPAQPAEDDRAWAAIRNSKNVADFLAFQLKYPKSPHSRTAASRIKELEQASPPSGRPPAQTVQAANDASTLPRPGASSSKQAAPGEPSSRPQTPATAQAPVPSEPSASPRTEGPRPPAATGTQKGIIRVRVRPFGYVYVDGELVGASPPMREIPLAFGRHRIEARNSEVRPGVVSTEVDVADSEPHEIQLRFSE